MPVPEEVDAVGVYGPMGINGHSATVARWQSSTFEGKALAPGRWYHVLAGDGITSYGMVHAAVDEFYAFEPYAVGETLGEVFASLNGALRYLVTAAV